MKNFSSPFAKLVAVAACILTLGSCNRAEYAMLPKGGSYHGVTRVATPVPPAVTPAPADPVAAPAPEVASKTEKAPAAVAATAPATAQKAQPVTGAESASTTASAPTTASARKPNLLQRLALNKVTRKMDKLVRKAEARQHDNTASTTRSSISGNLRIGIILLLIGLLVGLINGTIGSIIAIIGLVFIVLWLLDEL
jgi:hypothetical protein